MSTPYALLWSMELDFTFLPLVIRSNCVFSDSFTLGVEECVMDAVIEHNKLAASVDT